MNEIEAGEEAAGYRIKQESVLKILSNLIRIRAHLIFIGIYLMF